MMGQHGCWWLQ